MTELELKSFLKENFPKENEKCEWKEFKSLKSSISARQGEDLISYISSISNMEGGNIILGIEDKTLKQRVLNIYKKLDLPQVPNYDTSTLLEYVTHDKKSSHNTVSTVLVEQSGSYIIKELSFKEIQEVLERGPYEK